MQGVAAQRAASSDDAEDDDDEGLGWRMRGGDGDQDPLGNTQAAQQYFGHFGLPDLEDDDELDEALRDLPSLGASPDGGWDRARLKKSLYPGCKYSVEHFAYALFKIKTGSIHDDRADQLCKLIAEVMPPNYNGPK